MDIVAKWAELREKDPKRMANIGRPYEGACTTCVMEGTYEQVKVPRFKFFKRTINKFVGFHCIVCGKELL